MGRAAPCGSTRSAKASTGSATISSRTWTKESSWSRRAPIPCCAWWATERRLREVLGVVRVLDRLAHRLRKPAHIDHHLLLGDRSHRGKGNDMVAGVLDVDHELRPPARQHLADGAELLGLAGGEDLETNLDQGELPIHRANLSTPVVRRKAHGSPTVDPPPLHD